MVTRAWNSRAVRKSAARAIRPTGVRQAMADEIICDFFSDLALLHSACVERLMENKDNRELADIMLKLLKPRPF